MRKLIFLSLLSLLIVGCSKKEEENIDYAKQVIGKYKTKTLNINGSLDNIPDNVDAYHVITYTVHTTNIVQSSFLLIVLFACYDGIYHSKLSK